MQPKKQLKNKHVMIRLDPVHFAYVQELAELQDRSISWCIRKLIQNDILKSCKKIVKAK